MSFDGCSLESYADMKHLWLDYGGRLFLAVCETCHRFVKPDKIVFVNQPEKPNSTCKRCGRTTMHDAGWIE